MTEANTKDRIAFLVEKFDVFELTEESMKEKQESLENQGFKHSDDIIQYDELLAIVYSKKRSGDSNREINRVCVSLNTFTSIIEADPTPNKSCVQWILNVFIKLCLGNLSDKAAAVRLIKEDLPQASEYITLFEANKRKNKFKDLCKSSYILKDIKNPSDINQFKSLSQLYDAIDPFIEREPGTLESLLLRYVQAGEAEIPVRDRKFTLYIPKSLNASIVFSDYVTWCTARVGNSNFDSYTKRKTSLGTDSNLYIIINNSFFERNSQELYQIHFESNQLHDKHNTDQKLKFYENVISQSEGISNFFYEELMRFARAYKNSNGVKTIENNLYVDHLINFGFTEVLFELMEVNTPNICIMKRNIYKLPDLSRFKELDQLVITDAKLGNLHESIGNLPKLTMMVLANNKIKAIPSSIGNLKNLNYINLSKNPIEEIPEEIKFLDKSNGGSLFRITIDESEIGKDNFKRIRQLLPNTLFS